MQRWERPCNRCRYAPTTTKPANSHHPSFSSTLLDAIYRSMDEDGGALEGGPTREQPLRDTVDTAAVRKSTTTTEKVVMGRQGERCSANSASTSSESTSGGFSSSSSDMVSLPTPPPPKPIRTSDPLGRTPKQNSTEGRKNTEGSTRGRFRASEFYGELRKAKPPVSPGARLASFLTNLFAAVGNPKKVKASAAANSDESGHSSESSHSRSSRLVKTNPSSLGKTPPSSGGGAKRFVRFYPIGVVVGEEAPTLAAVRVGDAPPSAAEERKRAGEAERELVRRYTEKMGIEEEAEEGEDDGGGSCSSSDLFELGNLATIGSGGGARAYLGELPVYGTTRLETNRAIAKGPIS